MIDYRYVLIRYVPDRERMEPINVGVILQGGGKLEHRLNPHFARRKEIDTGVFRLWKQFFSDEIIGMAAPLFQPDRSESEFLTYLEQLCDGPVLLSRPLSLSAHETRSFADVLESLYGRLVAPPEVATPATAIRPTGRFRQLSDAKKFVPRGMRRYEHIVVNGSRLWMAYRQVLNGEILAFDKVEVESMIGRTASEIQCLPLIADRLPDFLTKHVDGRPTRYVLMADELAQPFTGQPNQEFDAMKDDLDQSVEKIRKLGVQIIRSANEAEQFANEIDATLPKSVT